MEPVRLMAGAAAACMLAGCNLSDPYPVDAGVPTCHPPNVQVVADGASNRLKPRATLRLKVRAHVRLRIHATGDCGNTVMLFAPTSLASPPVTHRVRSFVTTNTPATLLVYWVSCKPEPGNAPTCPPTEFGRIRTTPT
jgi:hypothetical protein